MNISNLKYKELLEELLRHTNTIHLDMGGKHRYSINEKGHVVITKIKAALAEERNDNNDN
jgi:predicted transcriptional regulator